MTTANRFFNKSDVASIIGTIPNNHVFSVVYEKSNGAVRRINAKNSVALNNDFVSVFDVVSRTQIVLNTYQVVSISAEKRHFIIK